MKAAESSFYEWQKKFSTDAKCMMHLKKIRWPNGFQCPDCGHDHGYCSETQERYERAACYRQTSVISGTLFHATKLPLTKWFWAIYWVATDKGGISALRLSKLAGC
ncbi:MAG: transposase [Candidatus Thiodiazotropha endolucinida]|uniref:Transposase n=1 Tax=Candidatus Thiodiazotropha taylori TaxID=2792791 RepID=A0A9E4NM90_9GAMM|nr:transposase [Candidatus Thiodiazotropha taylori]MCW4237952.1 transposase [Candidatus Thiodiazotropha endolucinida]